MWQTGQWRRTTWNWKIWPDYVAAAATAAKAIGRKAFIGGPGLQDGHITYIHEHGQKTFCSGVQIGPLGMLQLQFLYAEEIHLIPSILFWCRMVSETVDSWKLTELSLITSLYNSLGTPLASVLRLMQGKQLHVVKHNM